MPNKSSIISLLLVFVACHCYGQTWDWSRTAGGTSIDQGNQVKIDHDGNVIVQAYCNQNCYFDGTFFPPRANYVAKYDNSGNFLWVIPAGETNSYPSNNRRTSGGIEIDKLGNIFVTGCFSDSMLIGSVKLYGNSSRNNVFLAKLNPNGTVIWTKYVTDGSVMNGIALDSSNNVLICGYTEGISVYDTITIDPYGIYDRDVVFAKYDSSGNFIWVRQAGGSGFYHDKAFAIACDNNDNIYVGGDIRSDSNFGGLTLTSTSPGLTYYNGFLAKYDASGNALWVNYCGYACAAITISNNNEIFAGGYTGPVNGFDSILPSSPGGMFVAKLDPAGNYIWARTVRNAGTAGTSDMDIDKYGNVYATGHFTDDAVFGTDTLFSNPPNPWYTHMFLVKYDNNGNVLMTDQAGGPVGTHTWGHAIDVKGCEYVVSGSFYATLPVIHEDTLPAFGNYDMFVSKYSDVLYPGIMSATTSKSNLSCNGLANGTATVIPNAGHPPYSFEWDTNPVQNTNQISGLQGGVYNCTYTDTKGCSESISVNIFEPSALSVFSIINNPNMGDINLLVSGGVAPYTFNWNNGATTEDLTGVAPGFYFCQVSDRNGCAKVHTVILTSP